MTVIFFCWAGKVPWVLLSSRGTLSQWWETTQHCFWGLYVTDSPAKATQMTWTRQTYQLRVFLFSHLEPLSVWLMWRWAGLCLTALNLTETSAEPWYYYLSHGTLATKLPGRGRAWSKTHWPLSRTPGCPVFFTIAWVMVREVASPSGCSLPNLSNFILIWKVDFSIWLTLLSTLAPLGKPCLLTYYSSFVVGCTLKTWLSLWTLPNVPNFHFSAEAFESKIWTITIYLKVVCLSNVKEGIKEIDGETWKIRIWSR